MRRLKYILLGLFLVACAKEDPPFVSTTPIEFGAATKGQLPITTLAELAKRDFGVSSWHTPEGETFAASAGQAVKYFENHRFGYITDDPDHDTFSDSWRGVSAHAATTGATTSNPVYYPLAGALTYFCYAPYRSDAVMTTAPDPETRDIILMDPVTDSEVRSRLPGYLIGSPLFRYTPASAASSQVDFLVATPVFDAGRKDNGGRIPLDFSQHRLTQLKFAFNYTGELRYPEFICVTDIEIQQVLGSAHLYFTDPASSLPDCRWSSSHSLNDPFTGTPLPTTSYELSEAGGDLLSGVDAEVPKRGSSNDNHLPVCTDAGILYLLPQILSDGARLQVTYVICEQHGVPLASEVISIPLKTPAMGAWPAGKQVRYLLTLNVPNHQISGITAQLFDWEDAGNTHTPEQLLPHIP